MPTSWKKIGKVDIYGGTGSYFPPDGEFKLKVLKTFGLETRKSGDAFIVDFEVLESDVESVKVGSKKNWYQGLSNQDVAFPSIKKFMLELLQIDVEDEEQMEEFEENLPDLMEQVGDEAWNKDNVDVTDHLLHGKTIALQTVGIITKEKKTEFTVHNWSAWDAEG